MPLGKVLFSCETKSLSLQQNLALGRLSDKIIHTWVYLWGKKAVFDF